MDAVVEKEVVTPVEDKKPEWDKERQRADQAEASLRKTQTKLTENDVRSQHVVAAGFGSNASTRQSWRMGSSEKLPVLAPTSTMTGRSICLIWL